MIYKQMYGWLYYELYGNIFALQLLLSLVFFVIYQPRRKYFAMRSCMSAAGYLLLVNVVWVIIRAVNDGTPEYSPLFYGLVTVILAAAVFASFKTNILGAIYYATGAYAVQHAAYCVGNIIKYAFNPQLPTWANLFIFDFLIFAVVDVAFFMLFVWPRRKKFGSDIYDVRAFIISLIILALCILISSSSDGMFAEYIEAGVEVRRVRIYCSIYALIGSVGCIVIQSGFLRENKLSDEKAILDQLMYTEHKHHEMSKESIEVINTKCHDLKHQLAMLEKLDDRAARSAYIEELGASIAFYDGTAQTGNPALDIVISEKSLLCEKNNISLSCLVDGMKLSFMSSTDIASLFGNAFDNAIERELTESEDKRFISLSVREESGFIFVHMDNYCGEGLEFVDGLPQTTKPDKLHHGFGTKSIGNIVFKYEGEVKMGVEDERFNLDILFPVV